ncbi:hypothetical protein [Actinoplanes xinjiangensis]|uniref:hypothetical protein n=1 Tax=Actinoplanes xinjiangensis TaxID=512350 RepID=UPI00343B325A
MKLLHQVPVAVAALMLSTLSGTPAGAHPGRGGQPAPITDWSGVDLLLCVSGTATPDVGETDVTDLWIKNQSSKPIYQYLRGRDGERIPQTRYRIEPGVSTYTEARDGYIFEIANSSEACIQMFRIDSSDNRASVTYS